MEAVVKTNSVRAPTWVALAAAALLAACGGPQEAKGSSGPQPVRIDGSSTVRPLSQAVAAELARQAPGHAPATVAESGTTGGFQKFCRGEIDIAGASRPIRSSEMVSCYTHAVHYVEVPVAFDGVTIIVNPASPVRSVTTRELQQIWQPAAQGAVTNWRQVNPAWPDAPLLLFGPGGASGTFDYFTEVIVGERDLSRTDYTASEDDRVIVNGVAADPNAMGYVGHGHFEANRQRLAALAVDSGAGPVEPSIDNIKDSRYRPLSRPIFIYVNAASLDRPEVRRFAESYVTNAGRLAAQVGYIPLPQSVYEGYLDRIRNKRAGTAFAGRADIGATIEEVIARPLNEEKAK
jgi:phosphate transport system substrate-binding protein